MPVFERRPLPPPYDLEEAVAHLSRADRRLARVIAALGPCQLHVYSLASPFDALLESIVYQQLHGKAAATIYGRLCALFGDSRKPRPRDVLGASQAALRGAGLSQNKMLAIQDLAAKTIAGVVPSRSRLLQLRDEAIVERLTAVRGIGRWTVEMLLIFGLGRPDVLPVDDYGVRKGFARAFRRRELPTPRELAAYGERWRPYRSVASWYLWRATESPAGRA